MFSPHVPSSLSSAAPRRAWRRLLADRKRSSPYQRGSQISPEPFGPFLHPAHSSRRFASRASPEAWPPSPRASLGLHGSSFQQPLSYLLASAAPPAVAPTRLQPAPANSLLVNW